MFLSIGLHFSVMSTAFAANAFAFALCHLQRESLKYVVWRVLKLQVSCNCLKRMPFMYRKLHFIKVLWQTSFYLNVYYSLCLSWLTMLQCTAHYWSMLLVFAYLKLNKSYLCILYTLMNSFQVANVSCHQTEFDL